jgi:hypothetical protein
LIFRRPTHGVKVSLDYRQKRYNYEYNKCLDHSRLLDKTTKLGILHTYKKTSLSLNLCHDNLDQHLNIAILQRTKIYLKENSVSKFSQRSATKQ